MTSTKTHKKFANRWNNDYLFKKQAARVNRDVKYIEEHSQSLDDQYAIGTRETRVDMDQDSLESAFDNPQATIRVLTNGGRK